MPLTLHEELRAVQGREAAALALQRGRRRTARRQSRCQRDKQEPVSIESAWEPAALDELEDVAIRPGFVDQQLASSGLTPLGRWYLELRLLERTEGDARRLESADCSSAGADAVQQRDLALHSLLGVLARDKLCYDTVYARGSCVQDVIGGVQDDGVETAGTNEVLSFSTIVGGTACRVVCLRQGAAYSFRSSTYIPRLEEELRRLIKRSQASESVITDALRVIRSGLQVENAQ